MSKPNALEVEAQWDSTEYGLGTFSQHEAM